MPIDPSLMLAAMADLQARGVNPAENPYHSAQQFQSLTGNAYDYDDVLSAVRSHLAGGRRGQASPFASTPDAKIFEALGIPEAVWGDLIRERETYGDENTQVWGNPYGDLGGMFGPGGKFTQFKSTGAGVDRNFGSVGTGATGTSASDSAGEPGIGESGIEGSHASAISAIANAMNSTIGKGLIGALTSGIPGVGLALNLTASHAQAAAAAMAAMNADPNLSHLSQAQKAALVGLYAGRPTAEAQLLGIRLNPPDEDVSPVTGQTPGPGEGSPVSDPAPADPDAGLPTGIVTVGEPGIVGIGAGDSPSSGAGAAAGDSGGAPGGSAGAPSGGGDSGNPGDFRHGGRIPGKKDKKKKINAHGGEFVVNRKATDAYLPLLEKLNSKKSLEQLFDEVKSLWGEDF